MDNQYLSYLEEDARLYAVIHDKLPELRGLSATQIEKLVFYLKSLRGYYPKSESLGDFHSDFSNKLENLRNCPEQVALLRQEAAAGLKCISCGVLAGVLLFISLVAFLDDEKSIALISLSIAFACVLLAYFRYFEKAIIISHEQDRKYFLSSIRIAKACNELNNAGLFAYNKKPESRPLGHADGERVYAEFGDLTENLRTALYNDEYFDFSSRKLKTPAQGDG